jgi:hypothetical protein
VKAELASVPRDEPSPQRAKELEHEIHQMLFADDIEAKEVQHV